MPRIAYIARKRFKAQAGQMNPGDEVPEAEHWRSSWFEGGYVEKCLLDSDPRPAEPAEPDDKADKPDKPKKKAKKAKKKRGRPSKKPAQG